MSNKKQELKCTICGSALVEIAPRDYLWHGDNLVEVVVMYGCPNQCGILVHQEGEERMNIGGYEERN